VSENPIFFHLRTVWIFGTSATDFIALRRRSCVFPLSVSLSFFRSRVCDIRKEKNTDIPLDVLQSELCDAGFIVGAKWKESDLSAIENQVLSQSDTIGWINIYKRGVIAYVSARPKVLPNSQKDFSSYSNLISDYDGVVEEITVKKGTAVVSVGDTVQKGDLLISGIQNVGSVTVFCEAAGEVRIRTNEEISLFVPFESDVCSLQRLGLVGVNLCVFGREVNIFKNYGKKTPECVIINKIKQPVVHKNVRLPITLYLSFAYENTMTTDTLSQDEAEKIAKSRFFTELRQRLKDADLYRSHYETVLTEDGCAVKGTFTAVRYGATSVKIEMGKE